MEEAPKTPRATALVTGASSGIGYELAKLLAADGVDLVLVARDQGRLDQVAQELRRHPISVEIIVQDLAAPGAVEAMWRRLCDGGRSVDILVNNAGFNVYGPFRETDGGRELEMIQTNIVALTQLTKLALPGMLERGSGKILNLGSTASFVPLPFDAVYGATKAYVLSFSEALAAELQGTGVTVTALCPGATQTRFAARANMSGTALFQGNVASARDVARSGYRAMMRGRVSVIVGWANRLLIFSTRFSPRSVVTRLSKRKMRRVQTA